MKAKSIDDFVQSKTIKPMTKKIFMTWQTLSDVLSAHLYAIGAVKESRDLGEIWIKKIWQPDGQAMAEITVELK